MKTKLLLLAFLVLAPLCHAQYYTGCFQIELLGQSNRTFNVTRLSITATNATFPVYDIQQHTTDTNGIYYDSNMLAGTYQIDVLGPPSTSRYQFYITSTNALQSTVQYPAAQTIASPQNVYPPQRYAWSADASDQRYAFRGQGGVASNVVWTAAGANTTARTNGLVVSIDVSNFPAASLTGTVTNPIASPSIAGNAVGASNTTSQIDVMRDAGAKGDNSHDDTLNIQSAINKLGSQGGTVKIPPGTYKITDTLTITNPGVRLIGDSEIGSIIVLQSESKDIISADLGGGSGLEIANLFLQAGKNSTRTNGAGIRVHNAYHGSIHDVYLRSAYDSIVLDNANSFDVKGCFMDYFGGDTNLACHSGITVSNGCNSARLLNDRIQLGQTSAVGVKIDGAIDTLIANGVEVVGIGAYGFKVGNDSGAAFAPRWLRFDSCYVEPNTTNGIAFALGPCRDVELSGCYSTWGAYGAQLLTGSDQVRINGGIYQLAQFNGIYLAGGDHAQVCNSLVTDNSAASANGYAGIGVASGVSNWRLDGVRSGNYLWSGSQSPGFKILGSGTTNYTIIGCEGAIVDSGSPPKTIIGTNSLLPTITSSNVVVSVSEDNQVPGMELGSLRINNEYNAGFGRLSQLNFGEGTTFDTNSIFAGISGVYQSWSGGISGGDLLFATRQGGDTALAERLRINGAGDTLVRSNLVVGRVLTGDLSGGTNINAGNLASGTVPSARLPAPVSTIAGLADAAGWLHNDGAGSLAWSTPGGGGDVTQAGQNNFSGSNYFGGASTFAGRFIFNGTMSNSSSGFTLDMPGTVGALTWGSGVWGLLGNLGVGGQLSAGNNLVVTAGGAEINGAIASGSNTLRTVALNGLKSFQVGTNGYIDMGTNHQLIVDISGNATALGAITATTANTNQDAAVLGKMTYRGTAGRELPLTLGSGLSFSGGTLNSTINKTIFTASLDGAGSVISSGWVSTPQRIPCDCTITSASITADQSGSVGFIICRTNFAGTFPPSFAGAIGTNTLTSADHETDYTLANWTTALSSNDWVYAYCTNAATVTRATLQLIGHAP